MDPFPLEMRRDLELAVNQAAQQCAGRDEEWFKGLSEVERACALNALVLAVHQAHPLEDERASAVAERPDTHEDAVRAPAVTTPAHGRRPQDCGAARPNRQQRQAFSLLLTLFRIADARRRAGQCANGCSHWWHEPLC